MAAQFNENVLFVLKLENVSGSLAQWADDRLAEGVSVADLRNLLREAVDFVSEERDN